MMVNGYPIHLDAGKVLEKLLVSKRAEWRLSLYSIALKLPRLLH